MFSWAEGACASLGKELCLSGTKLSSTPLYSLHKALGAHFAPFAGFDMALRFPDGVLAEHRAVRAQAGLFDVSHMGQAELVAAPNVMEAIFPMALSSLKAGAMRYGLLLADDGGIVDDVMIVRLGEEKFRIIVNASRRAEDYALITARLGDEGTLNPLPDLALLALQGPLAVSRLAPLFSGLEAMPFMTARQFEWQQVPVLVSRSGYTGEDGFELSLPADHAESLARLLLDGAGIVPAGLAARDSLRLEAGLCLYGEDMDCTIGAARAGLLWTIPKARREQGGFAGFDGFKQRVAEGETNYRRVGLMLEGARPARAGWKIHLPDGEGEAIGWISSACVAPTSPHPLAMGYVRREACQPDAMFFLKQGERGLPAKLHPLPFRPHNYYRG